MIAEPEFVSGRGLGPAQRVLVTTGTVFFGSTS